LRDAAALVSFGYNCGIGALEGLLAGLAMLPDSVRAGGDVVGGLVQESQFGEMMILIRMQMRKA
jgi:hypothetical protein